MTGDVRSALMAASTQTPAENQYICKKCKLKVQKLQRLKKQVLELEQSIVNCLPPSDPLFQAQATRSSTLAIPERQEPEAADSEPADHEILPPSPEVPATSTNEPPVPETPEKSLDTVVLPQRIERDIHQN